MAKRSFDIGLLTILSRQARLIRFNSTRAQRHIDPKYLHDLRVAIRRFRTGMRLLRRHWPTARPEKLSEDLASFSAVFGPLRDVQVCNEFLESANIRRLCSADPGWESYRLQSRRRGRLATQKLRRILRSRAWRRTLSEITQAQRRWLRSKAANGSCPLAAVVAKELNRAYRRILKQKIKLRQMTVNELHDLRRLCRRCRYLVEFLTPKPQTTLAILRRYLKDICGALGDLHDADVHLRRIQRQADKLPSLCRALREIQRKAGKRFRRAWEKHAALAARRRFHKALEYLERPQ